MILSFLLAGCTLLPPKSLPDISEKKNEPWTKETYQQFLIENQETINYIYDHSYEPCRYFVDTSSGPKLIQDLIDPDAVSHLQFKKDNKGFSDREKAKFYLNFVLTHFLYFPEPKIWPSLDETLEGERGDCKGLSMLLISLLTNVKIACYGAINNGHMWVQAWIDNEWKILETDSDIERTLIYLTPGFYEGPLFKVYPDRAEKRKRKLRSRQ